VGGAAGVAAAGAAGRPGGWDPLRAEGGGPNHRLPFTDRVIATLVIMRFQLPHAALAGRGSRGEYVDPRGSYRYIDDISSL
jgi:hypothetical protein